MIGNISYQAWSPTNIGFLIVLITFVSVLLSNYLFGRFGGGGGGDEFVGGRGGGGSNYLEKLVMVAIVLTGAYSLRTTPLVSSLVDASNRLGDTVLGNLTANLVPLLLIVLFFFMSVHKPKKKPKHEIKWVWTVLLIFSVLGFAITTTWVAGFLDVFNGVMIFIYNLANLVSGWVFDRRVS